jgi:hypothetical protein
MNNLLPAFTALTFLSSPSIAEEAIFANLISQYDTACDFDEDYVIDDQDRYIVDFGESNSVQAYVINPESLSCTSRNVGLCGTRGCPLKIYIEGQTYNMVGWRVFAMQVELKSLLVLEKAGNACDDNFPNHVQCYELWEWNGEDRKLRFLR